MKYDQKYPDITADDPMNDTRRETQVGDHILKVKHSGECTVCGDETTFVSLAFESFFCSDDCLNKYWHKLEETLPRFTEPGSTEEGGVLF